MVKANWDRKVKKPMAQLSVHTSDNLQDAKEWIFDTWSESHLKAFLDRHGIPAPQPRRRDTLLRAVRENYEAIAKKIGETAHYPGDWLYEHWSESDLKEWLDERGWPVPQPTTRDRLVAAVRRHAHLSSLQAKSISASASSSADAAQGSISEALFNAWSDSELKKFLDKHNVKVPQGTKRKELIALARKHRASLVSPLAGASATAFSMAALYGASTSTGLYGAATSNAGNEYVRATDQAKLKAVEGFDTAVASWSDSRLKAFLDARGVPIPQHSKRDELLAKVRLNKHKVAHGPNAWTFETWDKEHLKKFISSMNAKASHKADVTRDELVKQAQDAYAKAFSAGGTSLASATSYLTQATQAAKDSTFDTWSQSDLKAYLDSYGVPVYQGSNINELRAAARRNAQYFRYGTSTPQGVMYEKLKETAQWLWDQLKVGVSSGWAKGEQTAQNARLKAAEAIKEKAAQQSEKAHAEL